jgi:hypothetical protein
MTPGTRTSRLSIVALSLALLGTAPCLLFVLGIFVPSWSRFADPSVVALTGLLALGALGVSIASLIRISRRRAELRGTAFAWAAVVISSLLIGLLLLFAAVIVFVVIPIIGSM